MTTREDMPGDSDSADVTPFIWWKWLLKAGIAAVGFKYGFDFGAQLSGVLLGLVVGLNAAAFCYFMAASFPALLPAKWRARSAAEHAPVNQAAKPGEDKAPGP